MSVLGVGGERKGSGSRCGSAQSCDADLKARDCLIRTSRLAPIIEIRSWQIIMKP